MDLKDEIMGLPRTKKPDTATEESPWLGATTAKEAWMSSHRMEILYKNTARAHGTDRRHDQPMGLGGREDRACGWGVGIFQVGRSRHVRVFVLGARDGERIVRRRGLVSESS